MCGIAGLIDHKAGSSETILRDMSCTLSHRGPDGDGVYMADTPGGQVGLGHRRLSIIDLSDTAGQPMHFDDLHLVFNGEIYNYNEIRDQLIALGHQFKTHSDTEVILHGWKEWGEDCIAMWRGMFSIALFDGSRNELVLIRDRAGVKPLFYYEGEDLFLFGSELKSIMKHPRFSKEVDPSAVAAFLQFGAVPYTHCIFKNCFKLSPGHLMRIQVGSKEKVIRQYWNVYDHFNKPKLKIDLPEAIKETEKILEEAFSYRMVADVPVGVFLSGGYDSTCVTALLQKNAGEKLKTFTIGSTSNALDEAPFAREVASYLGTDHHEYYCTPQEAMDIIPELPYYYDEPFADTSAIPTILVSRMARKKVVVALSADGGDEIFAGYNRYDFISRSKRINAIPRPMRELAAMTMDAISPEKIPYFNNQYNFSTRYNKLKGLLKDPSTQHLVLNLSQAFNWQQVEKLMNRPVKMLSTPLFSKELKPEYYDDLSYMMAIDFQTYLVDDILQKVDRATMSVSLEGREPFLDQHIVEWAARLPSDLKYHKGQKKYILKQIVHQHVPREMMERPKMGFAIPLSDWLRRELKPLVYCFLGEGELRHDLFDPAEVRRLLDRFYSGKIEEHQKIWTLLVFQMWYKRNVE